MYQKTDRPNWSLRRAFNDAVDESDWGVVEEDRRLGLEKRALSITLRAQLNEQSQLHQQLVRILECLPVGVILINRTGETQLVNRVAKKMLGLAGLTHTRQPIHQLWKECGLPPVPFSAWEHHGRKLTAWDEALGKPGRSRFRTARIIQDVTELSEIQRRMKHHEELAMLGEMVGKVVHDIRNPLGSIELFASLLARHSEDERERHCVSSSLRASVRRLDQLLSNLLVLTKPPTPHITNFPVRALLDHVELLAVQHLRDHRITLKRSIDPRIDWMQADETLLQQACLNVLLNAIAASGQGEVIEMTCRRESQRPKDSASRSEGDVVIIDIRDHGTGIAPEVLPKVFEPFFSQRKGGTGLGLSVAQQVMDSHRGHVTITSEEEKGTIVSLCIPQPWRPT